MPKAHFHTPFHITKMSIYQLSKYILQAKVFKIKNNVLSYEESQLTAYKCLTATSEWTRKQERAMITALTALTKNFKINVSSVSIS
uniref:AlNc14C86G5509 protein n=1 Tax=Albugo laibachii Nc14 TaxID=890382 RepID=F0WFX5_9STRA|nr:AlNc14C86G5509 [Albugo laibachii Nc14]|eukprot:CCA20109.1 AlNc14C86G5509 [Albugo laibachii Nc14]